MKKFTKILESNTTELKMNPKHSLEEILNYMGNEQGNFKEYMMNYLDLDNHDDNDNDYIEYENWVSDCDNSKTFDEFVKVMIKYNVLDDAKKHVYFHIMYLEDLMNNIVGNALKKINEE